jgi:lycopene cyclase domain-containing protein
MSYTQLSFIAVLVALLSDAQLTRSRMIFRKSFWASYAIILPFQLLTNWWLTSRNIVMYDGHQIIGWRIASAPVEDLLFGFALVLGILQLWSFWGKRI